jgi:hypothetical protein
VSTTIIYRGLISVRGCWLVVEWFFGWGASSHVTTFTLTHPYSALIAHGIAVALALILLVGMWFFRRWARWTFVVVLAIAFLTAPFRMQRYSLSIPPPFVAPVDTLMLLVTGAIVAMSFLPPVRDCFATREA